MPKTRPFQGVTLDTIKETRGTSLPVTFSVPKIYCLPLSILLLSTSSAIQHYKYPDHLHILILPLDSGSAVLDDLKYSTAPQMERVILFILLVASTSCQTPMAPCCSTESACRRDELPGGGRARRSSLRDDGGRADGRSSSVVAAGGGGGGAEAAEPAPGA